MCDFKIINYDNYEFWYILEYLCCNYKFMSDSTNDNLILILIQLTFYLFLILRIKKDEE